jgi:hypothetical protein
MCASDDFSGVDGTGYVFLMKYTNPFNDSLIPTADKITKALKL